MIHSKQRNMLTLQGNYTTRLSTATNLALFIFLRYVHWIYVTIAITLYIM